MKTPVRVECKWDCLDGLNTFKVTALFLYTEQEPELWTLLLIRIKGYPPLTLRALRKLWAQVLICVGHDRHLHTMKSWASDTGNVSWMEAMHLGGSNCSNAIIKQHYSNSTGEAQHLHTSTDDNVSYCTTFSVTSSHHSAQPRMTSPITKGPQHQWWFTTPSYTLRFTCHSNSNNGSKYCIQTTQSS